MVTLMVRHTIADYATWRTVFDAHEAFRRANGATGDGQVYRDEGIPTRSQPYWSGTPPKTRPDSQATPH